LGCELELKPGFEVCPGKMISFPVQHLDSGEKQVSSKAPKGVCHIVVGDCDAPVVSSGYVINLSNEDDSSDCVMRKEMFPE
jgi:hypothetical protein